MFIIFPNQLYYDLSYKEYGHVHIVEEPLLFYDSKRPFKYHKSKLAYLVAAMKEFENHLKSHKVKVTYIKYNDIENFYKKIKSSQEVIFYDPTDHDISQKYISMNPHTSVLESPNFLLSIDDLTQYQKTHATKSQHSTFYNFVKAKLNVLKDVPNLDSMNRSSLPKTHSPTEQYIYKSPSYDYAKKYISSHPQFQNNPGSLEYLEHWPINMKDARNHFDLFIREKLSNYGKYQDAIHDTDVFVFHSTISPSLNIGIISPRYILNEILKHQHKYAKNNIEGFIRQLIGWREYMRYLYIFHHQRFTKHVQENSHQYKRLSKQEYMKWTTGSTGIKPLDTEIQKALKTGYAHHIVRLMMFLNIFVLTNVHPEDIYKWFMEIVAMDAYDWVMKSNIYCMGYFYPNAMTKLYISTSNYILKMSNYKKGEWCNIWDALFYSFLHNRHPNIPPPYSRNYVYFKNLSSLKQKQMLEIASKYI